MPAAVTRAIQEHITLESNIGGYEAAALQTKPIRGFYVQAGKLLHCKASNIAFTCSATDSYIRALSSIPFQPGDIIADRSRFADHQRFHGGLLGIIAEQILYNSDQGRFAIRSTPDQDE